MRDRPYTVIFTRCGHSLVNKRKNSQNLSYPTTTVMQKGLVKSPVVTTNDRIRRHHRTTSRT